MLRNVMLGCCLAVPVLAGSAPAGDDLKSGPQVEEGKIRAFNPLHVTGPNEGKKLCLV